MTRHHANRLEAVGRSHHPVSGHVSMLAGSALLAQAMRSASPEVRARLRRVRRPGHLGHRATTILAAILHVALADRRHAARVRRAHQGRPGLPSSRPRALHRSSIGGGDPAVFLLRAAVRRQIPAPGGRRARGAAATTCTLFTARRQDDIDSNSSAPAERCRTSAMNCRARATP